MENTQDRTSKRLHHRNVIEQSQHSQHHSAEAKPDVQRLNGHTRFVTTGMVSTSVSDRHHSTSSSVGAARCPARRRSVSRESFSPRRQSEHRLMGSSDFATTMLADKTSQPVGRRGRRSAVGNGMRPLRLRGGGSDANSGARAPNQNGSRSASASVSTTSEHDAVGQTRESTTSSSSFDLQQYQAYTANGSLEPQPVPLVTTTRNSSSSHLTGSSNTSDHDLSAQGWSSGIHAGPAFVVNHPYQPVPLVAQHLAVSTTYSSASPATSVSYPQQLESHSRGHQPPPRAYSVSDSVTSSGTSYNGYGQPSGDGRARGPADNGGGSGAKGKGRSLEEDESAVLSGGEYSKIPHSDL